MTTKILTLSLCIAAISCSGPVDPQTAAQEQVERVVTEVPTITDAQFLKADLSISGMTCEMMCGGSIKKALAGLDGVIDTEIQFSADEELDHAVVTYDGSKVSDEMMIAAVNGLYDGQYKVRKVELFTPTGSTGGRSAGGAVKQESSKSEVKSEIGAGLPGLLIPSLLELLSRIARI